MRVVFAADHAGAAFKDELVRRLAGFVAGEHELIDLGGDGSDPEDDYPDFAQRLGLAIQEGRAERGILICGSGVGASVAANKMRGIRTAVCHDTYSAHQGVEHDDMNVLTLGARVIGVEPAMECSLAFLRARFSGETAAPAPAGQGPGDRDGLDGRARRIAGHRGVSAVGRSLARAVADPVGDALLAGNARYARALATSDADELVALFEPDGAIVDSDGPRRRGPRRAARDGGVRRASTSGTSASRSTSRGRRSTRSIPPSRMPPATGGWSFVPADGPKAGETVRAHGRFAETWHLRRRRRRGGSTAI